jgi:glycosyltransferase involved in cell wall biosynthesis
MRTRRRPLTVFDPLKPTAKAIARRILGVQLGVLVQHPPRPLVIPPHYHTTPLPQPAPSICIVTPSLNSAAFVGRTVESVLSQAYPALDYIVQDGGSTDDTLAMLSAFEAQGVVVHSQPDKGQSHALNRGFAATSAEIMAYLNADDLLLPGALAYIGRYFAQHPGVDAVYGHRVLIDTNDAEIGRWVMPPHSDAVMPYADYIPQETLFWRRSLWEQAGAYFREDLHYTMDWDLLLRFVDCGANIVRLPRFLGAFRVHAAQKTGTPLAEEEANTIRCEALEVEAITAAEIHAATRRYRLQHALLNRLYRLGVLRY